MAIIKYHKERIYNPNELKNVARRATQFTVDRSLVYVPLTSKAFRLLTIIPGVKLIMGLVIKSGQKLIENFKRIELLSNKEEK